MTARHHDDSDGDTQASVAIRPQGDGITLSWKGLASILGFTALAVAAWLSLKQDVASHTAALTQLHDADMRIEAKIDRIEARLNSLSPGRTVVLEH